jgi:hypothetical protein
MKRDDQFPVGAPTWATQSGGTGVSATGTGSEINQSERQEERTPRGIGPTGSCLYRTCPGVPRIVTHESALDRKVRAADSRPADR